MTSIARTFVAGTLGRVALPELTMLARSLQGWLDTAEGAGLDEDGIAALFATALQDRRGRAAARSPCWCCPPGVNSSEVPTLLLARWHLAEHKRC